MNRVFEKIQKARSLLETNPYLAKLTSTQRKKMFRKAAMQSTAIEGIHIEKRKN